MPIKQSEVYSQAADLIDNKGWCQGMEAQDEDGEFVSVFSERACKFCMTGAIALVNYSNNCTLYPQNEMDIFHAVAGKPYVSVPYYNDVVAKDAKEVSSMLRGMAQYVKDNIENEDR